MNISSNSELKPWTFIQKIIFRFLFIYFFLRIAPWTWLDQVIPGINIITDYYRNVITWMVQMLNHQFFFYSNVQPMYNGSGDTSYDWAELFSFLLIAFVGMLIWTVLDRKRPHYQQASYWLRTFLRYLIIIICMVYGIDKMFGLQMPFPSQSQLATSLGDLLPMRLSWMFIGYSAKYQFFSGLMEVIAGILLLNRKTITLGLLIALGVFSNVMMLNLSYDIPVKIFAIHMVIYCFYLLAEDAKRLVDLFLLNKSVTGTDLNDFNYTKKWMRNTRIVLKIFACIFFVGGPIFSSYQFYTQRSQGTSIKPITPGMYDVEVFAINKDTIPALINDSIRWSNLVFEQNGTGSVGSTDTAFRQRYRRGYFNFKIDTSNSTIRITTKRDSIPLYVFNYSMPDSLTIQLRGNRKTDSVYAVLKKSKRHFQLAEKQFHWISEENR